MTQRRMKLYTLIGICVVLALAQRSATADSCGPLPVSSCLYYAGDFQNSDVNDGRVNFVNGSFTAFVYDNFTVAGSGWEVTSVFTNENFYTPIDFSGFGHYEIRQGLSQGNAGTLIASGDAPMVETLNGQDFTGEGLDLPGAFFMITGLGISLAPGQYWMTVTPIDNASGECCFHPDEYFQWPTIGQNGFNTGAHTPVDSFFSSSPNAFNTFFDQTNASDYCGPNLDGPCQGYSMGLGGSLIATPEPGAGTLCLIVFASVGLMSWLNRKRYGVAPRHPGSRRA